MKTSRRAASHLDTLRTAATPRDRRATETPAARGAAYGNDVVSTLIGGTALLLTMSVFLGLA